MLPPKFDQPDSTPSQLPAGRDGESVQAAAGPDLTSQALQLRSSGHYALHSVESALQYLRAEAEIRGEKCHGGYGFEEAEAHYRAGAQGLRLSEIPQPPQHLRELSRLGSVDRAGRKSLRKGAELGQVPRKAKLLQTDFENFFSAGTIIVPPVRYIQEHHLKLNSWIWSHQKTTMKEKLLTKEIAKQFSSRKIDTLNKFTSIDAAAAKALALCRRDMCRVNFEPSYF